MYDPCIGAFDAQNDIYILDFIKQNNNVLGYNDSYIEHLAGLDEDCGWKKCEYIEIWQASSGIYDAQDISQLTGTHTEIDSSWSSSRRLHAFPTIWYATASCRADR
jgi:hypothetical protein